MPVRQHVWELPPVQALVVEHRDQAVCCPNCEQVVRATRPAHVPPGALGVQLTALAALLNGRYRLSKREVASLLEAGFGVRLSVGSVVRACDHVSAALAGPYAAAQEAVEQSASANVDETGWKQAGQKRWLWVAVTSLVSLFVLATTRAGTVLPTLLGAAGQGVVSSDRSHTP